MSDEFTFITDLSLQLANRYSRPVSSIAVTLQHGACMLFAGTLEPAYIMAVFALPSQVQTTINKRNAAMIQKHMEESIGVPPTRGHLRFIPLPEDNVAWNGRTAASEIAALNGDGDEGEDKGQRRRTRFSMYKVCRAASSTPACCRTAPVVLRV